MGQIFRNSQTSGNRPAMAESRARPILTSSSFRLSDARPSMDHPPNQHNRSVHAYRDSRFGTQAPRTALRPLESTTVSRSLGSSIDDVRGSGGGEIHPQFPPCRGNRKTPRKRRNFRGVVDQVQYCMDQMKTMATAKNVTTIKPCSNGVYIFPSL